MRHTTPFRAVAAAAALAMLAGCSEPKSTESSQAASSTGSAASSSASASSGSLAFPKDDYTTETTTVSTSDGEKKVTYHLYSSVAYVSKPVDATYESMNVAVPVEIDGKAVDASSAPILLNITVGGYMSASASGGMGGGGAGGGAMPSGGPDGGTMLSGGPGGGTMPSGAPDGGTMPSGAPDGAAPNATDSAAGSSTDDSSTAPSGAGNGGQQGFAGQSGAGNSDLALAAGYVVVTPGARGRDNEKDGTYYGKAPAAIVDLKAAVKYLHYNDGVIPGDMDHIISTGTSAGGALSALLGASAGSSLYDEDLAAIGAADASDSIFAVAAYCPITDLNNADGAYEWAFGTQSQGGAQVDQTASKELAAQFTSYETKLKLTGLSNFGTVTGENMQAYMLQAFLEPAATKYLAALSDTDREAYLTKNPWISWQDNQATFTWADFASHVGRSKSLPAFDALDLSAAENIEFGDATTNAKHFTEYSVKHDTSGSTAIADETTINEMNPMYFLTDSAASSGTGRATHWFLRTGTSDTDTSPTVLANLATAASTLGDTVDVSYYWDAGHGANEDADAFIAWIGSITT